MAMNRPHHSCTASHVLAISGFSIVLRSLSHGVLLTPYQFFLLRLVNMKHATPQIMLAIGDFWSFAFIC